MPVIAYRGESSLAEILDRLYLPLEPGEREIAGNALLRSNPQLRNPRAITPGAVLLVPEIPSLAAKTRRDHPEPHAALADLLRDAVSGYASSIKERVAAEKDAVTTQTKLLRSAAIKRLIANDPTLQAMAGDAEAALGQRSKRLVEDQKMSEIALREMLADLARVGK